tara:strand:- start:523 stop:900 length:378 start_codon:yes stop_codon:yes gene_type:complete
MDKDILIFLNKCKIVIDDEKNLEGLMIPRDILLDIAVYDSVKEDIQLLKQKFSSSSLTALQRGAEVEQKWPLLNLVRQILKSCNYNMTPIRQSNGYDGEGKKKYKRFFRIDKLKSTISKTSEMNC